MAEKQLSPTSRDFGVVQSLEVAAGRARDSKPGKMGVNLEFLVRDKKVPDRIERAALLPSGLGRGNIQDPVLRPVMSHHVAARGHERSVEFEFLQDVSRRVVA